MPESKRQKLKAIKIWESTYNDLQALGSMSDTFAHVVDRVVQEYKKGHHKQK
jgi:hypothetical protein